MNWRARGHRRISCPGFRRRAALSLGTLGWRLDAPRGRSRGPRSRFPPSPLGASDARPLAPPRRARGDAPARARPREGRSPCGGADVLHERRRGQLRDVRVVGEAGEGGRVSHPLPPRVLRVHRRRRLGRARRDGAPGRPAHGALLRAGSRPRPVALPRRVRGALPRAPEAVQRARRRGRLGLDPRRVPQDPPLRRGHGRRKRPRADGEPPRGARRGGGRVRSPPSAGSAPPCVTT